MAKILKKLETGLSQASRGSCRSGGLALTKMRWGAVSLIIICLMECTWPVAPLAAQPVTVQSSARRSPQQELSAEVFRLERVEYERTKRGDFPVGVFKFRYKHSTPLSFWGFGEPVGGVFKPRFTNYRIRKPTGWESVPVGYDGTGPFTFNLVPDTDYELRISLAHRLIHPGDELRVSLKSPAAKFWSEPFTLPTR